VNWPGIIFIGWIVIVIALTLIHTNRLERREDQRIESTLADMRFRPEKDGAE
jgi:hypothetical protein